jgi:hypothetical protein
MFIAAPDSIHYRLKQHMDDFVILKKKKRNSLALVLG